jgi:hypothetical protein
MSGKDFYDDEPADHTNAPPAQYYRPDQRTTGDFFAPPAGAQPKQPTVYSVNFFHWENLLNSIDFAMALMIFGISRALKNEFSLSM